MYGFVEKKRWPVKLSFMYGFVEKKVISKSITFLFPKFFLYRSPGIAECFRKWMECRPQVISRTLLVSGPPARFRDYPLLCVRESDSEAVRTKYDTRI